MDQLAAALDSREIMYSQVFNSEGFLTPAARQELDFLSHVKVGNSLEGPK